jgi:hypothetical protein
MQILSLPAISLKPTPLRSRVVDARPDGECQPSFDVKLDERDFGAMYCAFRPYGGFASGDELVRRLRRSTEQPLSLLARAIVRRSMLTLCWRGETLAPVFQFDMTDMSVRPACASVFAELNDVYDSRELALWFASPNLWLHGSAPVALLATNEVAVLQAARADRFVARG